jgi:hypothetical protein
MLWISQIKSAPILIYLSPLFFSVKIKSKNQGEQINRLQPALGCLRTSSHIGVYYLLM